FRNFLYHSSHARSLQKSLTNQPEMKCPRQRRAVVSPLSKAKQYLRGCAPLRQVDIHQNRHECNTPALSERILFPRSTGACVVPPATPQLTPPLSRAPGPTVSGRFPAA
ncbi:unnamed protein product, partial [Ectocarpus sp. 8 AP-2014]